MILCQWFFRMEGKKKKRTATAIRFFSFCAHDWTFIELFARKSGLFTRRYSSLFNHPIVAYSIILLTINRWSFACKAAKKEVLNGVERRFMIDCKTANLFKSNVKSFSHRLFGILFNGNSAAFQWP